MMRVALKETKQSKGEALDAAPYRQRFVDAMDDDFNTPQALAALFDLARDINRAEEEGMNAAKGCETLKELGGVLGLTFKEKEEAPIDIKLLIEKVESIIKEIGTANDSEKVQQIREYFNASLDRMKQSISTGEENKIIDTLLEARQSFKKARYFHQADLIRNRLADLGIILEDTPQRTVWKRKR
ncbi:MAG: hypothetical protein A2Z15_07700 [Chloroflexi bacterium RBG_16_50_11]|nr:MAG: hypothetical protein A2Z15_07700 [Chloroflexi bacterium RBG_16_50_11]